MKEPRREADSYLSVYVSATTVQSGFYYHATGLLQVFSISSPLGELSTK